MPGQDVAASIVAALPELDQRSQTMDARIGVTFRAHLQAEIVESMPGIGTILGAELIAAAGDLSRYADAGHLASAAGLVPVPGHLAEGPAHYRSADSVASAAASMIATLP